MDLKKSFGQRVKELRKKCGLTQEELAEKTELSVTFIGLVERGVNIPSVKTCDKIAKALGVSLDELFYFQREDKRMDMIKSLLFKIRRGKIEEISLISEVAERILEYSRQKK